ncbi:hypothetical protein J4734_06165, partial [Klebsiella pneumoniae]|nr:hypothetical protein [Klebsiella pneumoniae]
KSSSGCIPSRRSSPSSPNRFRTGSAITSITILCHERDNFRIPWRSPTRCSRWISTAGQRGRKRSIATSGSTPSAWCCAATARGSLNIYSTHYLDASHPVHDQSEVDEAGTLTSVFKSSRC